MKRILIILWLIFFLTAGAAAVDVEETQADALGLDSVEKALPEEAEDVLDGLSITDGLDADTAISKITDAAGAQLDGILKRSLRSAALMIGAVFFCSVAGTVSEGGLAQNYVPLAGILAVSAVAVSDAGSFFTMAEATVDSLSDFSKVLLPCLTASAAASGAITSAAAKYAATALFIDILITAADCVIMPLIYAYIAATVANAAFGGDGLSGAAGFLKWAATSALTATMLLFVAYLSISGVISGSADALTTRVAKTAISTALPVVGSIISDAAGTVVAGATVLRNAIGIFGMLAVAAACLTPFLTLGVNYLVYKAAAGISASIADGRISKLISGIGTAFGMVMGLTGACAVMLFFSIISMISVVTGS